MISALPYCAESWELLIDTCPSCGRQLGWNKTCGIDYCEHCEADLKDAVCSEAPLAERPLLAILAGLASPSRALREAAVAATPDLFHRLGANSIFEFILAVSRAAIDDRAEGFGGRIGLRLTTTHLVVGTRMILDYPASFDRISGPNRGENTTIDPFFRRLRSLDFGFNQELREFVSQRLTEHEPIRHGPTRLKGLREEYGRLSIGIAAQTLGLEKANLRKLIDVGAFGTEEARGRWRRLSWFSKDDVEAVGVRLARRMSPSEFSRSFGLPLSGIEQLISLGFLQLNQDPWVAAIYPGVQLDRASALECVARLQQVLWSPRPNTVMPSLTDVFHGIGGQEKPWGAIVHAALEHKLPDGLAREPGSPLKFDELVVSRAFARELVTGRAPELQRIPSRSPSLGPPPDFNRIEVERYLNCYPRDVSWLLRCGHLTGGHPGQRNIPRRPVEELGRTCISSREISWRWQVSPAMREGLATQYGIARTLGPFWPRRAVTEHFANRFGQAFLPFHGGGS